MWGSTFLAIRPPADYFTFALSGAGISVSAPASIPDFRSSTGLFKSLKEQHPSAGLSSGKDLFDARLFSSESNTALFYSMIASLHSMTLNAQPTLFHHFLKRLDEQGRLQRVYTQNIDALEERAGLTFGLGQGVSAARASFKRTASLGKRKRAAGAAESTQADAGTTDGASASTPPPRRQPWSKVQSAPAGQPLLAGNSRSPEPTSAMFPRVIPLHGSLSNLVCTVCDYKMSTLPEPSPEVKAALEALNEGDPPHCPECSERDAVRVTAGLRSRGIGFMKPDVVLYNGPNKSGERVGECLERDVLGLRDRLDGRVPETYTEEKLRLKKEDKERAKREEQQRPAAPVDGDESFMSGVEMGGSDDVLARVFEEDEEEEEEGGEMREQKEVAAAVAAVKCESPAAAPSPTARLLEGVRARKSLQRATTQPAPLATSSRDNSPATSTSTTPRNAKMKPLPPDLLIVAGTSLKVPGTKRVVREFAKAARARDGIVPKGCKSRLNKRGGGAGAGAARGNSKTPSSSADDDDSDGGNSQNEDDDDGDGGEDDDDASHREDGSNPYRPIRTILLNYDFPIPSKEWEGVFDVWVQGDVQAAAAGLWSAASGYGMGNPLDEEEEEETEETMVAGFPSWEQGIDGLDDEREAAKKAERGGKKSGGGGGGGGSNANVATANGGGVAAGTASTKRVPVVEIMSQQQQKGPPRRSASASNLAPSRKANGGGVAAANNQGQQQQKKKQQATAAAATNTVDRMFPPTKRGSARSRSVSEAGKAKGGVAGSVGAAATATAGSRRKASGTAAAAAAAK